MAISCGIFFDCSCLGWRNREVRERKVGGERQERDGRGICYKTLHTTTNYN